MSRVDDNSDNRRIREMNEAAHNKKIRNEKKSAEARGEQTFREVMQKKARTETAQRNQTKEAEKEKGADGESVLDRIRKRAPKKTVERDRRQALQRSMQGGLLKKKALKAGEDARAEAARGEELKTGADNELERVEKEVRKEDEHETVRSDEKQAEVMQEARADVPTERADPDGRRQQRQSQGRSGDGRDNNAQAIQNARRAGRPAIPQEVLQRLVSAIYKAVNADGRTSMRITLKGGKLEGVTVDIKSEGGKVSCEFGNCPKELKSMLKKGTSQLAKGLSRRGLKLERLSVRD
ncbi:MAG: flagellar hook-length control protein FliK [Deltaproteobacteria bacterium]